MSPNIVVCHARKGGVGKTTIAYEVAWLLGAPLIDLDWEDGGATKAWGYRHEDHARAPMLDALAKGTTPRLLSGFSKPHLLPGHPDFEQNQPAPDEMADALVKWAGEWGSDWVVVDTHPGASDATNGALSVANVVLAPVPLGTKELTSAQQLVRELADYPIVLIPNKVPSPPPRAEIRQLAKIVEGTPVQVGPPVPYRAAVGTRKIRMAITSGGAGKALGPVADAMEAVAAFVRAYVDA